MVTVPVEGRWSLKPLTEDDAIAALHFLQSDALNNVYLISRLEEERTIAATQMVAVRQNGKIVLVASLATNIVLAADKAAGRDRIETAMAILADRILTRMVPVRAIISPAELVEALWTRLRARLDPPTVVRMNQPVYALRQAAELPDLKNVRPATMRDIEPLVAACAAMHKEEVGIDPMERDAAGYRERIRELIERRRALIRILDGTIASKCEFSAVTGDAVQLMGVWTHPRYRRRGLARETLQEICGHLFRSGQQVTLFVNYFNLPAVSLYESMGFEKIGMNRALIW